MGPAVYLSSQKRYGIMATPDSAPMVTRLRENLSRTKRYDTARVQLLDTVISLFNVFKVDCIRDTRHIVETPQVLRQIGVFDETP